MAPTTTLRSLLLYIVLLSWNTSRSEVPGPSATVSSSSVTSDCSVVPTTEVRDTLETLLLGGSSLVYIQLRFQDEAELSDSDTFHRLELDLGMFQPWSWQRSSSRQGRSLLMLSDHYDVLSMSLLTIRVGHLDVTLTSSPPGCVSNMTSRAIYEAIRALLLSDFRVGSNADPDGSGSLSKDEHVCYRQVRRGDNDVAEFVYVCCHDEQEMAVRPGAGAPRGGAVCADVTRDPWIQLLLAAVVVIKVLVVLFSPNLLPETVYRLKYATLNYVYHLPHQQTLTLRMLKTAKPWIYGKEQVVRLSKLQGAMPKLRQMIATWDLDRVYDVRLRHVQLGVKARKLLGENYVPVSALKVLYNNLFLCRLRHITSLTGCCGTNILGTLNPGLELPTWFKCARLFARVVLLVILVLPWLLRLLIYYRYERPLVESKERAALGAGLNKPFTGSFTLYLTPLHVLFVICYVILCVDSFVYGVLSEAVKKKMKLVIVRCLRDMKERSKVAVCGWVTAILVLPCTVCGLLGFLFLPLLLLLLLPILIPILAFYLFPAINLSVRLVLHLFIFLCPSRIARAARRLWKRALSRVNRHVRLDTLTAEESFESKGSFTKWELPFQVLVVLVCLLSFWSITFLVMELLSFAVEMGVYTFIGVIVTADVTSQYLSIIFFLLLYGNSCFSAIYNKYLKYHRVLHRQLMSMVREEINSIARTEELDQENTALRVQGDMAPPTAKPPVTLRVFSGRPRWSTSSILLFLDSKDTPYTTEKFFRETVDLNYCGCPGQLYLNILRALLNFLKIIVFLVFVFVVVMAFGNAYSVSSSNQLMATVAGGFIPFVFTRFFSRGNQSATVDPDSVQFKTHFHTAINSYEQNWPVFDIVPEVSQAKRAKPDEETKAVGTSGPLDTPPLSSSTPYSTLASSRPSSNNNSDKDESVDWEDTSLDIIFDVSTRRGRGAHAQPGLGEAEVGSQTMLNRSRHDDSGGGGVPGGSSRKYRPTESSFHEGEELIQV